MAQGDALLKPYTNTDDKVLYHSGPTLRIVIPCLPDSNEWHTSGENHIGFPYCFSNSFVFNLRGGSVCSHRPLMLGERLETAGTCTSMQCTSEIPCRKA